MAPSSGSSGGRTPEEDSADTRDFFNRLNSEPRNPGARPGAGGKLNLPPPPDFTASSPGSSGAPVADQTPEEQAAIEQDFFDRMRRRRR